jgi:hypothetical protein
VIGAARYFAPRYFAARYWAKVGADVSHVLAATIFDAPLRRMFQAPKRRKR